MNRMRNTRNRFAIAMATLLVGAAVWLAPPSSAFLFVLPSPSFPTNTVVGETFPATLGIGNFSTPPESTANPVLTISAIDLYPACSLSVVDCSVGVAEGGVFALSGTGTGAYSGPPDPVSAATCNGTWTITPSTGNPNTAPRFRFVPPGGEGTLLLPTGALCAVSFTALTRAVPTIDALPAPGVQTIPVASSTATGPAIPPPGLRNQGSSSITVAQAVPGLTTDAAQSSATIPGTTSDVATLSPAPPPSTPSGAPPTGTITFELFGPTDPTCIGPPIVPAEVVPVNGFGDYNSSPVNITAPGTYRWVATYSGDANYVGGATACGEPLETVTFAQAAPTLTTDATTPVVIGGPISDNATLAGGFNPTGNITFNLYGPGNPTCTGAAIFTSTIPVAGNGVYNSGDFTPTTAGTYNWRADYSGDVNNLPASSPCGTPNETSDVTPDTPDIVTLATPNVTVNTPVTDTATLSNGTNPTGTITFELFGPGDPTCAGPAVFTDVVAVAGNGDYTSGPFTPTTAGSYNWIASYSGDVNNNPVAGGCGDPGELTVVAPAQPTIVTAASGPVPLGQTITDTATLAGGFNPTGDITFTLFGPTNPTCAGPPIFTSVVPVAGNGDYVSSPPFAPPAAGTYQWVAVYSGDVNNQSVTSPCGAPGEASVVNPITPAIVTSALTPVTLGSPIRDTATVTGAPAPAPVPTGSVTFTLFGPANPTCTGVAIFTSTNPVGGPPPAPPAVQAVSGDFTPTAAGTYNWVAVYSGDSNYTTATSPCGAPDEASVVTTAPVAIATIASGPVTLGSSISDTATVTGAPAPVPVPTGTVTFNLFGPANPTCTGAPIFTSTNPVGGPPPAPPAVQAVSGSFTPTAAGTYQWVAIYSGDANYPTATSPCGAPGEASVVTPATVTIVTSAEPTVTLGGAINDTATVTGVAAPAPLPTGTVTFTLFGPANPTCTGAAIFTSTNPVGGPPPAPPAVAATSDDFTPTAVGSYNWVATYNGDANYTAVTSPCGAPDETSVVTPVPTIQVVKTATPLTRTAPGGDFTFDVVVTNTSNEVLTITSLTDDVYGDITTRPGSTCNTAIGTVLQPGGTYSCAFTGPFTGVAGDSQTDIVTVRATNPTGVEVTDDDDAVVSLTPVPTIQVVKTATPLSRPAPGGDFTFDVVVTNTSNEVLTITSLTDDVYGDITTRPNSSCNTAIGTVLQPGGTYSCAFTAPFNGAAGASQTDVVTVRATNPAGVEVNDDDDAVVTLTPQPTIQVDKTATPLTRPAPGGDFTFNIVVTNTGNEVLTITSLTDDVYGNLATRPNSTCNTAIGTVLQPGGTYTCSFTAPFNGAAGDAQTDVVTVRATNPAGVEVTDDDDAVVTLTPAPTIQVDKTATPLSRPAPGGDFTFAVVVTNTSNEVLTITSLTDDVYGDITTRAGSTCNTAIGTVLQPGGTYSCSFTAPFTGASGSSQTDVVTVRATNPGGVEVTDSDDAVVTLTPAPTIRVDKTATPISLPEPGGDFRFNVVVTNTSNEVLTITSLTDDVYGNITTRAGSTCNTAIGTVLQPGGTYSCSFTGPFFGDPGDNQTDVVTVRATNPTGVEVTDEDDTLVFITDVVPAIHVDKSATPSSRPEPGGSFTFSVVVTNIGSETLTITALTDDVYGNLATKGTCTTAVGTVLAPGASYSCSFSGDFIGNAGQSQTDVVTVRGQDDEGTQVTDDDDAIVFLTNVPPTIVVVKDARPTTMAAPGGTFTFDVAVTNTSFEPVTITALTDNIYGNLNGRGTCRIGAVLRPGQTYRCSFPGDFTGPGGASQTDRVTATAVDDDNTSVTAFDDAVVTITAVPVVVVKVPPPKLVRTGSEVGGPALLAMALLVAGTMMVAAAARYRRPRLAAGLAPSPIEGTPDRR